MAAAVNAQSGAASQVKTASVRAQVVPASRYVPGEETHDVLSLFRVRGDDAMEKRASAEQSYAAAERKYGRARGELQHLTSDREALADEFVLALSTLVKTARQQIVDGDEPWAIGAAIERAEPSVALSRLLVKELGAHTAPGGLQKMAEHGYEMAPEGDAITGLVQDLERISQKLVANQEAVINVQQAIAGLLDVLMGPPEENPTASLFTQDEDAETAAQALMAGPPMMAPTGGAPPPGAMGAAPPAMPGQPPQGMAAPAPQGQKKGAPPRRA